MLKKASEQRNNFNRIFSNFSISGGKKPVILSEAKDLDEQHINIIEILRFAQDDDGTSAPPLIEKLLGLMLNI